MIVPENTHGWLGLLLSPIDLKKAVILSYERFGDRTSPYNVLLRRQSVPGFETGQPCGGLQTTISFSGKIPLQNAFLTSPCLRIRRRETASESIVLKASCDRTGAYV